MLVQDAISPLFGRAVKICRAGDSLVVGTDMGFVHLPGSADTPLFLGNFAVSKMFAGQGHDKSMVGVVGRTMSSDPRPNYWACVLRIIPRDRYRLVVVYEYSRPYGPGSYLAEREGHRLTFMIPGETATVVCDPAVRPMLSSVQSARALAAGVPDVYSDCRINRPVPTDTRWSAHGYNQACILGTWENEWCGHGAFFRPKFLDGWGVGGDLKTWVELESMFPPLNDVASNADASGADIVACTGREFFYHCGPASGEQWRTISTPHPCGVVAIVRPGKLVAAASYHQPGFITIVDLESGRPVATYRWDRAIADLAVSPDGNTVTLLVDNNQLLIFDLE